MDDLQSSSRPLRKYRRVALRRVTSDSAPEQGEQAADSSNKKSSPPAANLPVSEPELFSADKLPLEGPISPIGASGKKLFKLPAKKTLNLPTSDPIRFPIEEFDLSKLRSPSVPSKLLLSQPGLPIDDLPTALIPARLRDYPVSEPGVIHPEFLAQIARQRLSEATDNVTPPTIPQVVMQGEAPSGWDAVSQKLQAVGQAGQSMLSTFSQQLQAVNAGMISTFSQQTQAIGQKLQAVWIQWPYRVKQLAVMSLEQQQAHKLLTLVWIATNLYFWIWWLQPAHVGNPVLFGLMCFALFYEATLLPSFYTFYLGNMRQPEPVHIGHVENSVVQKVAVISLTVPGSESLEIVRQQLIAMQQIEYPHDSWILVDKEHSPEIRALAQQLGVFYFSRHDAGTWGEEQVKRWNQPVPPFKAKTKAGNVNSWIDAYGLQYSHFTQLDIDHRPVPEYLHKVLGYFLDPQVKWVQAPSVYGNTNNWTARGSAEQEFVLQGPLQMGFYGFCETPFIIGSHCTYDMTAIRAIGGFQPTRAEDHLDTVFLAAQGHRGVFVPETIAVGDGPENFEMYLAQQFAWAYSMIQVLFLYTPKSIKNYTPRQAIQFLFVQTWYVVWSVTMFLLFMLPVISLLFDAPIAHVNYWDFVLHGLPVTVTAFMIWAWSHPWHLPGRLELSWRGVILHIARWPVVLSALVQVILRIQKPYMITVKGLQQGKARPFSLKPHYPNIALVVLSLGACWFYLLVTGRSDSQGYLLFALQGAATVILVYVTALFKDMSDMIDEGISFVSSLLLRVKPLLMLIFLIVAFFWTAYASSRAIYEAIIGYEVLNVFIAVFKQIYFVIQGFIS